MLIWDFINKQLSQALQGPRFSTVISHSGPYKFILLFDEKTRILYSLMRGNRFNQIKDQKDLDIHYYLKALASINDNHIIQTSLFDDPIDYEQKLTALCQDLYRRANGYMVILFDTFDKHIVKLQACLIHKNWIYCSA